MTIRGFLANLWFKWTWRFLSLLSKMKTNALILVLAGLLLLNCKKEEPEPAPLPVEQKSGDLLLKVVSYDSLGQVMADQSGQKLRLDASHIATTDAAGEVRFTAMPYGDYFPSIVRDFWEGPALKVTLAAANTSSSLPFAQIAVWRAQSLTAIAVRPDSIVINFKLDRAVPAGKQVKMALLAGTENNLSGSNYKSVDIFFTSASTVNQFNIANFARFKNLVAGLDSGKVYFIKVLPVSYGEYTSNVLGQPVLLGDNLFPPDNWLIKKEWK